MSVGRFVKFTLAALVAFALGATLAIWQRQRSFNPDDALVQLERVNEGAPDVETDMTPLQDFMAEEPDFDAPEMPEVADIEVDDAEMPEMPTEPKPVAGVAIGGDFVLVNHNGQEVKESTSWIGKYRLVFFGFTHCPEVCPAGLSKLSLVMKTLDPAGKKFQPLFITTDPERDTPQVMKDFIGNYSEHIVGLTGSKAQVRKVVQLYKVYAMKGEVGDDGFYSMDHSAFVYLMSPEGKTLKIISGNASAEDMIEQIRVFVPTEG